MPAPIPALDSILTELQIWLQDRTGTSVGPDLAYVEAAELDSFDVMELVVFVEDHFRIRFESEDLADAGFLTLAGLSALVRAKLQAADGARP